MKLRGQFSATRAFPWVALRYAFAGGMIVLFFRLIPLEGVAAVVRSARAADLLAASAALLLAYSLGGYRLKLIAAAHGIPLAVARAVEINTVAVFYGILLPGGNVAGAGVRMHRLFRAGDRMAEAFAAVAIDRIAATLALFAAGALFWLVHLPRDADALAAVTLAVLGCCTLGFLYFSRGRLPRALAERLSTERRTSRARKLLEALTRCRDLPAVSVALIAALSLGAQLLGIVVYHRLAASVGIEVSFVAMAWIRSAALIVALLPVSISGVGLREGALVVLLKRYGVAGDRALAFAMLVFALTVLMMGVAGGLVEARRLVRLRA